MQRDGPIVAPVSKGPSAWPRSDPRAEPRQPLELEFRTMSPAIRVRRPPLPTGLKSRQRRCDNSPTFQRWGTPTIDEQSPKGTTEPLTESGTMTSHSKVSIGFLVTSEPKLDQR